MAKVEPKKVETVPVKEVTEAKSSQFGNILFDFDKYTIREDAKPTLKAVADWLIKNKDAKIILEGHCDDRELMNTILPSEKKGQNLQGITLYRQA